MAFRTMLHNEFFVDRELSSVYTATPPVADDVAPAITIVEPDNLEIVISGFTDGTGSVTIDGTDPSDAVIAETISFPGNGQKVTNLDYKTVTRVRTSGLADETTTGTLTIKTASGSGGDNPVWSRILKFNGRLIRPKTAEAFRILGERADKRGAVFSEPGLDIVSGDKISLGPDIWEVEEIHRRFKRVGEVHHWQIVIKELESPAE
jgi:hypothetical protein